MNKHTRSVSLIDGHTEEMTDAEIIKALECCSKDNCEECPANGFCDNDDYCFTGAILDLINRQKAEIELLQKTKQLIKSEAIKEFWKRFDKVLCENIGPSKRVYWKISSDGDNIVKEMTEGKENG